MSHSLSKILIHVVIRTKNQYPYLKGDFEKKVHQKITEVLENECDCGVIIINGIEDHIHILFRLNVKMSLADIMQEVKGSTSYWINKELSLNEKFKWQLGYGAFSVSENDSQRIYDYIKNQKEHHKDNPNQQPKL